MRKRKFILGIAFIMAFAIMLTGCSSNKDASMDIAPSEGINSSREEMGYDEDYDGISDEISNETSGEHDNYEPDKIITTVYIEMQTKEFLPTTEKLENLIKKHKGYIENSDISYNDYIYSESLKHSDYAIRIPRENLEAFVDEIVAIGNIISQNKSKQDVTKQYRDTESRLKVLNTKEERILALLEKAEKMEDIIVLEDQLSHTIYEKESLTQSLTTIDDQVNYSTVHLNLQEVAKLSPGQNSKTPFSEKLKTALQDSFYFFTKNIGEIVIGLIYFLPYGLILIPIVYLVFIWKKRKSLGIKKDKFPEDK